MKEAGQHDLKNIENILTLSFRDNKSVLSVVKNDRREVNRIRTLIRYSIIYGKKFGKVWISEDGQAACIVLFPEKIRFSLTLDIFWSLRLLLKVIGISNTMRVLRRQSAIKQNHPKEKFYHLWYIGTMPNAQGSGYGSALLREILSLLDENKRPVYLETSVEKNVEWYENFGFEKTDTLHFEHPLYLMKRN